MHNSSYLGGALAIFIAVAFHITVWIKNQKNKFHNVRAHRKFYGGKILAGQTAGPISARTISTASRVALKRLIDEGHICVDGKIVKATHSPRAGERIQINWPDPKPAEAKPEKIPLDILFEDKFLLVLNKPVGLLVHPSAGHEEHTLVNLARLHHCEGCCCWRQLRVRASVHRASTRKRAAASSSPRTTKRTSLGTILGARRRKDL